MSTNGSEIRQLGRDHDKFRDNMDDVTEDTRESSTYTGREVAKKDLPDGLKCRIIYGKRP